MWVSIVLVSLRIWINTIISNGNWCVNYVEVVLGIIYGTASGGITRNYWYLGATPNCKYAIETERSRFSMHDPDDRRLPGTVFGLQGLRIKEVVYKRRLMRSDRSNYTFRLMFFVSYSSIKNPTSFPPPKKKVWKKQQTFSIMVRLVYFASLFKNYVHKIF